MSESTENVIVLRATPGRDATASEIARGRGEFRRQPHLTTITVEVEAAPAAEQPAAAEHPAHAVTPRRTAKAHGQYGRSRVHH